MKSLPCTENRTFFGDDGVERERGGTGVQASSLLDHCGLVELTPRSEPMYLGHIRIVPTGTWQFREGVFHSRLRDVPSGTRRFRERAFSQTDSAHVMNQSIVLGFDGLCGLPERRISLAARGSPAQRCLLAIPTHGR